MPRLSRLSRGTLMNINDTPKLKKLKRESIKDFRVNP